MPKDFASGFVHFENGATMVIECAWLQHQKEKEDFSARIFGKKAGITWPTGDYAQTVNGISLNPFVSDALNGVTQIFMLPAQTSTLKLGKVAYDWVWFFTLPRQAIPPSLYGFLEVRDPSTHNFPT